jgi:hypothetical protein
MQKWDYLHVVVDYEGDNFQGCPRYVNGQELPNWEQGENIFSVMNTLGWKGWELVSNLNAFLGFPIGKSKQQSLIFRRPKA